MRPRSPRAAAAALAAAALAALIVPGAAAAGTSGPGLPPRVLIVGQDGRPGEFTSVQAAIDAVPSGAGPVTIVIEPGTYQGQVYVPASKPGITLTGATGNPRSVTLVDLII